MSPISQKTCPPLDKISLQMAKLSANCFFFSCSLLEWLTDTQLHTWSINDVEMLHKKFDGNRPDSGATAKRAIFSRLSPPHHEGCSLEISHTPSPDSEKKTLWCINAFMHYITLWTLGFSAKVHNVQVNEMNRTFEKLKLSTRNLVHSIRGP